MKVYIAGRFSRQSEFRRYRDELQHIGITVNARWLDGHGDAEKIAAGDEHFTDVELAEFANEDLHDIDRCDLLIAFTESPDAGYMTGGRHVELGLAIAKGKVIVICGPVENVFHRLGLQPGWDMPVCPDWHATLIEVARRYASSRHRNSRQLAARA